MSFCKNFDMSPFEHLDAMRTALGNSLSRCQRYTRVNNRWMRELITTIETLVTNVMAIDNAPDCRENANSIALPAPANHKLPAVIAAPRVDTPTKNLDGVDLLIEEIKKDNQPLLAFYAGPIEVRIFERKPAVPGSA